MKQKIKGDFISFWHRGGYWFYNRKFWWGCQGKNGKMDGPAM